MLSGEDMTWLVGQRCQSFAKREFDWVVAFDGKASLVVGCLWRLIENDRIRFTSQDEGQQFGLPAPIDAAAEAARRIAGALIESIELRDGTLDMDIHFATGHVLQIIPDSSGYEAWILLDGNRRFIAVGGGDLTILADG